MLHLRSLSENMLKAARPLEHLVWRAVTKLLFSQKLPFESELVCSDTYVENLPSDIAFQLEFRDCQGDDVQGW